MGPTGQLLAHGLPVVEGCHQGEVALRPRGVGPRGNGSFNFNHKWKERKQKTFIYLNISGPNGPAAAKTVGQLFGVGCGGHLLLVHQICASLHLRPVHNHPAVAG